MRICFDPSKSQIIDLVRRRLFQDVGNRDVDVREESHTPESPRSVGSNVDYGGKVSEWLRESYGDNAATSSTNTKASEYLGELEEVESFWEAEPPDIAIYRECLMNSCAYKWLLGTLQTQRNLAVEGGENNAEVIRNRIINAFGRPGNFSRSASHAVEVRFDIAWDPQIFADEEEYDVPVDQVLSHAVALTGRGNSIQAITCAEYLVQTWPQTGPHLLKLLQKAFSTEATLSSTGRWTS